MQQIVSVSSPGSGAVDLQAVNAGQPEAMEVVTTAAAVVQPVQQIHQQQATVITTQTIPVQQGTS